MTGISSQFSILGNVWQCESVPKKSPHKTYRISGESAHSSE